MSNRYGKITKKEFLSRIIDLYGRFLDDGARKIWVISCNDVLSENINYNGLWWYFCREFQTKTVNDIPSCQWLYQASRQFLPEPPAPQEKPEREPPPEEWYKTKQKLEQIVGRKLDIKSLKSLET